MLASRSRPGNEATNQPISRISPRLSLPSMRCSSLLAAYCFYSAYLSISKARFHGSLVFPRGVLLTAIGKYEAKMSDRL